MCNTRKYLVGLFVALLTVCVAVPSTAEANRPYQYGVRQVNGRHYHSWNGRYRHARPNYYRNYRGPRYRYYYPRSYGYRYYGYPRNYGYGYYGTPRFHYRGYGPYGGAVRVGPLRFYW